MLPDGVIDYVRDTFLLSRGCGHWSGEDFEDTLARLASQRSYGGLFVQGPGLPTLFGRRGASGFCHEIDVALQGRFWVGLVEAKTGCGGPSKADVLIFDGKTFDLYMDRLQTGRPGPHVRILASSVAMRDEIAAFAAHRGIISVDPDLVPLPLLLRLLAEPIGDRLFTDWEMAEADRLFTPVCVPMEEIWRPCGADLSIRVRRFDRVDTANRTALHRVMSARVIAHLDRVEPGWAEQRAARLIESAGLRMPVLGVVA